MKIVITEAGQSLADIALQVYGTVSPVALFALVDDNPAVFPDGISSLVPAGLPVQVRDDAGFTDSQLAGYFSRQVLNSGYVVGQDISSEGSGEGQTDYTYPIALDSVSVIVLHAALIFESELFSVELTILNAVNIDFVAAVTSNSDIDILEKISVYKENQLIYINFEVESVRYKITSVL